MVSLLAAMAGELGYRPTADAFAAAMTEHAHAPFAHVDGAQLVLLARRHGTTKPSQITGRRRNK
jgi:hypothetical protein